jgi:hypothetical protein
MKKKPAPGKGAGLVAGAKENGNCGHIDLPAPAAQHLPKPHVCRAIAPPLSACSSTADTVTVTDPMTAALPAVDPLIEHARAIRALGRRAVADIIEIGRLLIEAKQIVGHGGWLPWLEREFGWTDDTALNFMRVHELSKSRNFRDLNLPVSSLYLLAAPSTPDEARLEIAQRAEAGEQLPIAEVKRVVAEHKRPYRPTRMQAEYIDASSYARDRDFFARKDARALTKQWTSADRFTREYFVKAVLDDMPETIGPIINEWLKSCPPRRCAAFLKQLMDDVGFERNAKARRGGADQRGKKEQNK